MFLDAPGEPFLSSRPAMLEDLDASTIRIVQALFGQGWTVPVVAFEVAAIVAASHQATLVDGDLNGGSCGTRSREFTDQGVIDSGSEVPPKELVIGHSPLTDQQDVGLRFD